MRRSLSIAIGCAVFLLAFGISPVSAQTATGTSTPTAMTTPATETPTTAIPSNTPVVQSPTNTPIPTTAQSTTPTLVPSAVATGTSTRTPTAVSSPVPTRTAAPTRTPTATKTPAPRILWTKSQLEPVLASGEPVDQIVTFSVQAPMSDVNVRAFSPGNAVLVGSIPSSLQPGETYQLPITITVPNDRRKWPLRATVRIRSGNHTIGPILFIRAKGPPSESTPRAGEATAGPGTPTAVPVGGTPTTGSTIPKVEVTWHPGSITQSLTQGTSVVLSANFEVSAPVLVPKFHAYAREGSILLDPSSLPETLVPGQTYSLRFTATMPLGRSVAAQTATILIRDGGRSLGDGLTVRIISGT